MIKQEQILCKDILTKLANYDFIDITKKCKILKILYILFPFAVIFLNLKIDIKIIRVFFKIFLFISLFTIPSNVKRILDKITDRLSLKIACFFIICGIVVLIFMNIAVWFAI